MTLGPGSRIAHYELIEQIGEGGMGTVWKAYDTHLRRHVAMKVLPAAWAAHTERLKRFEHEAQVLASLDHPNIVVVHSVEMAGEIHFFTMELVHGRTLDRVVPPAGLPAPAWLDLAAGLADAVSSAHSRGVVHRDLKPANVMITEDGRVKVLDFGLARSEEPARVPDPAEASTADADGSDRFSGTWSYMAPERLRGQLADARADVFSLGILLHQMASGRHPFAAASMAESVAAILRDPPPPLREQRPDLPAAIEDLVFRCLDKDPAGRITSRAVRDRVEDLRSAPVHGAGTPVVAVLPFSDLSREQNQEYLCDGIAGEILHALARLHELRVLSRSSSFRFRRTSLTPRAVGRRLGATWLVEGSVRQAGGRLHVGVTLSNVADGVCRWSEHYDRRPEDVFELQDDIARAVASALRVTPRAAARAGPRRHTHDATAYDLYLRGRNYFEQYSRIGMEHALAMFGRATERDPGYAMAWAGLAECHAFLFLYADGTDQDRDSADETSRRAVDLDPELAQARMARGLALSLGRHHDRAEIEFETALRLDPNSFEAHYFYARDRFMEGELERAVRLYERASALRPEDHQPPLLSAQIYDDLGRPAEAAAARRRGVAIAAERLELHPDDTRALYMGANGLVALGELERGLEWARRAFARDPHDPVLLYNLACIFALAGRHDEALDFLERTVQAGLMRIDWLRRDSNLDSVRSHPRFVAALGQIERAAATRQHGPPHRGG
jgi:serine/threonine protein kinase/tetratricopeptide (TPR) repeat protein